MNVLPYHPLRSYMFHFCCPAIHDILRRLCSNTCSLYKLLKLLDLVICRDFGCIKYIGGGYRDRQCKQLQIPSYSGRRLSLMRKIKIHGIIDQAGGN